MTIDEMIEVLQAFKDGKEIEYMETPYSSVSGYKPSGNWVTHNTDKNFNFESFDYRIKLQLEYVPFTHLDYELFMGKIIIDGGGKRQIVLAFDDADITTTRSNFGYARAFEVFKFIDGTPFGKLKQ